MQTDVNQKDLRLAFGVHRGPLNAPGNVLRQIENEAQALAVSILAGQHKLAYVAACIGRSESYVSLMQSGKRPIPHKLVAPLCAATGTNLLSQFIALQRAMSEPCHTLRLAEILRAA